MDSEFVGLDPGVCRLLAGEFRGFACSAAGAAKEFARIDAAGDLGMAFGAVRLLARTENDLLDAANLLARKAAEVESIVSMTPDGAVDVLTKNFERLDSGGGKHGADGVVSVEDLQAVADTTSDPELLRALSLVDGAMFHVLDTGGRVKQGGDGKFSEFDLGVVREKKISFTDLRSYSASLAASKGALDVAAHGGKGDGTFSVNDLKALVKQGGCDPRLKSAVEYFLKDQDQLRLVEGFKASQPHIAVRIVKGLGGAVPTLNNLVNPASLLVDFVNDPFQTTQRQLSLYKGVGGAVVGMGKGLWEINKATNPLYGLVDPAGQRKALVQWKEAGVSVWRHPGKAFEMIIDIETLESDPDKWVGQLAPDVMISALTGGGGAVGKTVKAAKAFKQLRHVDDFNALSKLNKLNAVRKVANGADIILALKRADRVVLIGRPMSLNSASELMGIEPASQELIEAVARRRTVVFAEPGSDDLRYLDSMGAEANVGGPDMTSILLRKNPSKAQYWRSSCTGLNTVSVSSTELGRLQPKPT